jgi:DNA gyrase subunit A
MDKFDDLYDDENSISFYDNEVSSPDIKKETDAIKPQMQDSAEEVTAELKQDAGSKENETAEVTEETSAVIENDIIDEPVDEPVEEPIEEPVEEPEEKIKETEEKNIIENADEIVAIADADLKADKEKQEREKEEQPKRKEEERLQKLLQQKAKAEEKRLGELGAGVGKYGEVTAMMTDAENEELKTDHSYTIKDGGGNNNSNNDDGGDGNSNGGGGGDGSEPPDGIIEKSVAAIMHNSMIPYSEFVILDRALPRVEDGLKPVQRRILFAMNEMGLTPDKPFRKSAGIVGECLGKYHPHGDTSVYDAMVRMAQPFNMNMPLILGQGNFGSDDGDGAAAMRYTEAKLAPLALELLRDIEKETVPFSLTYDDRNTEPDTLPAKFPNLLTNGASGIAVGLATNIPPHNLAELIDAHIAFIDNPKITLAQVLKIIKGPDFPTGGYITADENLVQAYTTGKGKVTMSSKIHIEVDGDKRSIVITELPYQINKVALQKNIADIRETKKGVLQNIKEIRDESDRNGTRIIIRLSRDADPKEIITQINKFTSLRCNFNFNMVAIANGKPRQLGLMQIIEYYVNYQREVIYKRSVYDLRVSKERAHILEGLLIAIKNIDAVIKIIKTSKHTTEARDRLQKTFKLTERQAQAILDLRLARLTSLEVYKLEEELRELMALIEKLTAVIGSKRLQFQIVKDELNDIKKRFKIERRTKVVKNTEDVPVTADDDAKPVEESVIILTPAGTVKRVSVKHFNMSNTNAFAGMKDTDINSVAVAAATDKVLYFFTNIGNCFKLEGYEIPECKIKERGIKFKDIFSSASNNEVPIAVYAVPSETLPDYELVWLTKLGMIKRSKFAEACNVIKSNFQVYKLREDRSDEVLRCEILPKDRTIVMVTNTGNVLNAATNDVPLQGRIAGGVKGIQIDDSMFVAGNTTAKNTGFVVAVTNLGNVKKTEIKQIDKMVRYRKGLMLVPGLGKGEEVIYASWTNGAEDLVIKKDSGECVFAPIEKIPCFPRTGKMKNVFGLPKGTAAVTAYIHRRNSISPDL